MKHWLKGPGWLDELLSQQRDLGLDWLSESASAELLSDVRAAYEEDGYNDYVVPGVFADEMRARLEHCVPLAHGAKVEAFDMNEVSYQPLWWFDREQPDVVWFALTHNAPCQFWVPVVPSAAAMAAVVSQNIRPTQRLPFAGHARLFAGTVDGLQMERENFENHYVMTAPVSSHMWGSEFDEDPWPDETRDYTQLDRIVELRRAMNQRPGRVERTHFRTQFSRSVLTVEDYNGHFVFDLRYTPQTITQHVETFNATYGYTYPVDAPVDVLCAILGFVNISAEFIVQALDRGEFDYVYSDLQILSMLEPNPVAVETHVRRWIESDDAELRRTLTSVGQMLQLDALLLERWALEPDAALRADIATALGFGGLA